MCPGDLSGSYGDFSLPFLYSRASQRVVLGPAEPVLWGHLLEMQILRLPPSPLHSDTRGEDRNPDFNKFSL